MGLVICPEHGNGFLFVCPHVITAIEEGTPCHGIQRLAYTYADPLLADFVLACWFCPQCITCESLPPTGAVMNEGDEFFNNISNLYRPTCPGCFEKWRSHEFG
jgi:hypothetical protein